MAETVFARRQAAAKAAGYSGYAAQRKARQTGQGLRGPDVGRRSSPTRAVGGGVFTRRQAAAKAAGYTGYAAQRKARQTGQGLRGPDVANAAKIAGRRRIIPIGKKKLVKLTRHNKGEAAMNRLRDANPEATVKVSWIADSRSGPIPMSRDVTWDELDLYESVSDFTEAATAEQYLGGSWAGATTDIQVLVG